MAFVATGFPPGVIDVDRMFKFERFLTGHEFHLVGRSLGGNGVTIITLMRDNHAIFVGMEAIMTPITSWRRHVTNMVCIMFPAHFHFREYIGLECILNSR